MKKWMLALSAALPGLAAAAPGATSPYRTDAQHTHVEDATSRGVEQVNMITCFMSAMRPDALVNQGNYIALVDQKKCDSQTRSSTDNSGSGSNTGSNAPSYMTATVNAERTSNTDPMRVKVWVDEKEQDFSATIFVNVSATEAPSATNPYGIFRLDYCGKGDTGPCMMRGYLDGNAEGISFFEIEQGFGGGSSTKALRLTTSGADSGAGRLSMDEGGQNVSFSFAYNSNYFLRHLEGGQDQCFSRDANDLDTGMSVWRYGLYDGETGERVTRNSGFPIEYTASNGTVVRGHMGYWGLGLPPEASIASGATVQRVEYSNGQAPTKTDYTLVKAEGRLMKYSKQTKTLAAIDKIRFQTWVGDVTGFFAGATPNQQYEMYWDDAAGAFKVTGMVVCENGPCQTSNLGAEQTVEASFFANMGGVRGWSQALGGELFIPLAGVSGSVQSATLNVVYRTQDLVYPSQLPSTLYCLRDCPTAATISSFFSQGSSDASPFVASTYNHWGPMAPNGVVGYTTNATSALLMDGAGAAVTFTNREALQSRPQFQWGVRTGRLFTSLEGARCDDATNYCEHKVEQMETYYQWETGPNQWNQFAALRDAAGTVVTFQAPLQVSYNVPNGAAYGAYAGKSIVLQYGGFGELWGIPGRCVSRDTNADVSCDTQNSRYVPAFVIPFDEVLGRVDNGGTPLLAKWLDREIRFARKNVSVCTAAGVTVPSGLTLPTASELADPSDAASAIYIGVKPTLTAAPRVIHGDVKF